MTNNDRDDDKSKQKSARVKIIEEKMENIFR